MTTPRGRWFLVLAVIATLSFPAIAHGDGAVIHTYSSDQAQGSIYANRVAIEGGESFTELQLNMWQVIDIKGPTAPQYDASIWLARWVKFEDGSMAMNWGVGCFPDPPISTSMPPGSMTFDSEVGAASIAGTFTCLNNDLTVFTISIDLAIAPVGEPVRARIDTARTPGGITVIKSTQTQASLVGTAFYDGINWAASPGDVTVFHGDGFEVQTPTKK